MPEEDFVAWRTTFLGDLAFLPDRCASDDALACDSRGCVVRITRPNSFSTWTQQVMRRPRYQAELFGVRMLGLPLEIDQCAMAINTFVATHPTTNVFGETYGTCRGFFPRQPDDGPEHRTLRHFHAKELCQQVP